ncbi:RWP-RK domain-containing protein [Baffinella frigidus]|nr:RWP-RK domain-containing protein [Cryptophyta sp. CCMP2293]
MPESTREELCRHMTIVSQPPGAVLDRSTEAQGNQPWRVVFLGRLAVISSDVLGPYPVWFFEPGQTFARSYLNLFVGKVGLRTHIEALTAVRYLELNIPPHLAPEFKVWTRPLWYEELAQYFHVSINEAAEALGICPSAIKRVCRRHGLSRWPHRRIISIERSIGTLESKLEADEGDPVVSAGLRTEVMELVRNKILSRCNLSGSDGGAFPDLFDDEDRIGPDAGEAGEEGQARQAASGGGAGGDGRRGPRKDIYTPNMGAVIVGAEVIPYRCLTSALEALRSPQDHSISTCIFCGKR